MAYQDPYAVQHGRYDDNNPQYRTTSPEAFNPYSNQANNRYDQPAYNDNGGYTDEPTDPYYQQQRQPTYGAPAGSPYPPPKSETPSGFERGEFTPTRDGFVGQEKNAQNLRAYRYDAQGNLWKKGSRAGCITRFVCCTFLIIVFLFISIILALALWIRPPSVILGDIAQPETGSQFQLTDNGVKLNFNLNVSVSNPNYFSIDLKKVKTDLFYPINDTDIGGGTSKDIVFESHSNRTVSFPFSIDYTSEIDPNNAILQDLLQKCGVLGTASDINVRYEITLTIRILIITVSPKISNSFSFTCPLDQSTLGELMGSSGLNIGDILGG